MNLQGCGAATIERLRGDLNGLSIAPGLSPETATGRPRTLRDMSLERSQHTNERR